jgi:hypothetical protein
VDDRLKDVGYAIRAATAAEDDPSARHFRVGLITGASDDDPRARELFNRALELIHQTLHGSSANDGRRVGGATAAGRSGERLS